MNQINATIVTIGDELLIGQTINTNAAWIAKQLNMAGVNVSRQVTVGDDYDVLYQTIVSELKGVKVLLLTGGLGPTSDDKTKEVLCKYFGGNLVMNKEALAQIEFLYSEVFKRPLKEPNRMQALLPDVCEMIPNRRGTAPGMIFKKNGQTIISMPGVPYEMKGMMEDVLSILKKEYQTPDILHKTLLTAGVGESVIAEMLVDFEKELPKEINLAYLPDYGMVRLRLSAIDEGNGELKRLIEKKFNQLKDLTSKFLVTDKDEPIQVVLGDLLKKKNQSVSTAESCTGGGIAALITSVPGSSAYFEGSVVSYSNRIKEIVLGVEQSTLKEKGAVSEETVIEMLNGILRITGTTYGIAVSGILGPDGGSEEKPVGTVWIAVGSTKNALTHKVQLRFDRNRNAEILCTMALNKLREFIIAQPAKFVQV